MNTQKTLLVHMAETKWTKATMRLAAQQAHEQGAQIVLAKMLPASYLNWQGLEEDEYRFTDSDCDDIYAYEAIAREHGVSVQARAFKYQTLEEGITRAAHIVHADAVFASLHEGALPFLHEESAERLETLLQPEHCTLYVVEQPAAAANWMPTATAVHHS